MKTKRYYSFFYQVSNLSQYQYINIFAVSVKQACYFFKQNGFDTFYDYSDGPIDDGTASEWHSVGEVHYLPQY